MTWMILAMGVGGRGRRGVLFFFSSRRRHTRCSRDWSSDVCSSDLALMHESVRQAVRVGSADVGQAQLIPAMCAVDEQLRDTGRSLADPWVEHNCGDRKSVV